MTDDVNGSRHISVSMPIGALATVLVIALAGFAYTFLLREDDEGDNGGRPKAKGSIRRKVGLKTLIAVIENDTSRRLLLAVLRALARRG